MPGSYSRVRRSRQGTVLTRFRYRFPRYVVTIGLTFVAVISIYPVLFTAMSSLRSRTGYAANPLGIPSEITFENYREAFSRMDVPRLLLNSTITTVVAVLITVSVGFIAAYAIARIQIPGANMILLIIIATLAIPGQAIIFPLFETIRKLGYSNEYEGLILAYASFGLPLSVYLFTAYLRSISSAIVDAALVDGAGHFRIMWNIMLPIATPAVAALAILNFVWMWNDLLLPLVIMGGSDKTTLMVGVARLSGEYDISVPLVSAGLIIALMPVFIVYIVFQRMIHGGAMSGAVK